MNSTSTLSTKMDSCVALVVFLCLYKSLSVVSCWSCTTIPPLEATGAAIKPWTSYNGASRGLGCPKTSLSTWLRAQHVKARLCTDTSHTVNLNPFLCPLTLDLSS